MTNLIISVVLPLILGFLGCTKDHDPADFQQFTNVEYNKNQVLDSFALDIKQYYQLPGLAIATIKEVKIEEIAITGRNKSKQGSLLNKKSKFQIGSCGKSFTALLVATFVEEGLISWDTKISDIPSGWPIHKDFKSITIRQLLAHTSGLPQFWTDDEVFNIQNTIPHLQGTLLEKRNSFATWNLKRQASFKSGEHHYSNAGYIIVASLLEKIKGQSYESLIKERIFQPLKLNSAQFGYPFLNDTTQPYRHQYRDKDGIGITLDGQTRLPDPIFNPSGFISLSIEDFARYIIFFQKALKGENTEIQNSIVQELFQPVIKLDNGNEVGMGWQIIYVNGTKTFGHTGSDGSIRSAMSIEPGSGRAVGFATNIGDQRSEIAMINVILELLELHGEH